MSESEKQLTVEGTVCPVPLYPSEKIVLGHGSGGRLMHGLIASLFLPAFDNPVLRAGNDAGRVSLTGPLAISTDSHVVWPLFFPGGDIGRLAVCGTVNDVSMLGAEPHSLTASFILEEGLEFDVLERIVRSMQLAAEEAGVQIIAGDTKVVEKGKADGLYITTAGVGPIFPGTRLGGERAQPGDKVILSGTVGDHGIAVLSARGELGFIAEVESDIAPLNHLVRAIMRSGGGIHVLRDPTRGGVATTLNEIARASQVGIVLEEGAIPVRPAVQSACELLGFDPLYVANEGKLIAIVDAERAERVLGTIRGQAYGEGALIIGEVAPEPAGRVLMRTALGSHRVVDELSGEMLPRIC
jgi:hydrogenase expression/formation protein HypE